MVKKCADPDCKSRYASEKVVTFLFPRDTVRRSLWISNVPRKNFAPSKNSVLCEKHFLVSDIDVRTLKKTPEKTRKVLKPSAVPCLCNTRYRYTIYWNTWPQRKHTWKVFFDTPDNGAKSFFSTYFTVHKLFPILDVRGTNIFPSRKILV